MILNGIVWLIIAAFALPLIDVTDKYTRKAVKWMGAIDDLARKFMEDSLEWILNKNLKILFAFLFVILFGILSQLEIIPKLIS
tara:strand:- start:796 stop:1044 length:249 start_codon:yes stop_codon:yes gene_type:complete